MSKSADTLQFDSNSDFEDHKTVFAHTLKRPLSSSPAFFLGFLGSLALICMLIASVWAYLGARWVLVFAVVDVLALGAAALWCIRHALDFERVSLTVKQLRVERQTAGHLERWEMERFYVRLQPTMHTLGPFKTPRLRISARQQVVEMGGLSHSAALRSLEIALRCALKA